MLNAMLFALFILSGADALSAWTEFMGGSERTGSCKDGPGADPRLLWVYSSPRAPEPSFYRELRDETLGPQKFVSQAMSFDFAFSPVVSGGRVYFGSSSQDCLVCLDAVTGRELWTFFTDGALRLAPSINGSDILFGSDDGNVYCLDCASGKEKWRFSAAPEDRRIIANGKIGSQWPIRTSVSIKDSTAYFSAGLFPANGGVFLYAVNTADGKPVWKKQIQLPSQGYIYADEKVLYVPNGRASPAEYSRADGSPLVPKSDLRRQGGSGKLWTVSGMLAYGPTEFGLLHLRTSQDEPDTRNYNRSLERSIHGSLTGIAGESMLSSGETVFWLKKNELLAIPKDKFVQIISESAREIEKRIKKRIATEKSGVQLSGDSQAEKELDAAKSWKAVLKSGKSLAIAGDIVVAGTDRQLLGFDLGTGAKRFEVETDGSVWDLAADGGRIFASTDKGSIYCVGTGDPVKPHAKPAAVHSPAVREHEKYSSYALKLSSRNKGFCAVIGLKDGRLLEAVADSSKFRVIGIDRDAKKVSEIRKRLYDSGKYGGSLVVQHIPDGSLPYVDYFANIIMSESGEIVYSENELQRILNPYNGVIALRKEMSQPKIGGLKEKEGILFMERKGGVPGMGNWTHMFADAANTACSGDSIVGGLNYRLQWFGDPSPPRNVGWHGNGMGPIYSDGLILQVKTDTVEAVDLYNGTSLWTREIKDSARFSPGREGGSACADAENLYVAAKNKAVVIRKHTGEDRGSFAGPGKLESLEWGYIAVQDGILLGSKQDSLASFNYASKDKKNDMFRFKGMWAASEPLYVVSNNLFALNSSDGSVLWEHDSSKTLVLNSSITVGGGRVYFVENRNTGALEIKGGSVFLRDYMKDAWLVALDLKTGRKLWDSQLKCDARTVLYASYSKEALYLCYGYHVGPLADAPPSADAASKMEEQKDLGKGDVAKTSNAYGFIRIEAGSGVEKWRSNYISNNKLGGQHNYNVSHPVLTSTEFWHAPAEQYIVQIDRESGKITQYKNLKRQKGCMTPTSSERAMFFRSMATAVLDFKDLKIHYISQVSRPSCWMSVIPAGGRVMMPEYSVGCNCAFPLQTSIVMSPEEKGSK